MFSFDGIVFDMDGVIFDTETMALRCWQDIGGRYGLEDVEEASRLCIGRSTADTKEIFRSFYGDKVDIEALYEESKIHMRRLIATEGIDIKPGARELLEWLSENGIKVGLCSSTNSRVASEELENAGLLRYFNVVVGGEMVAHSKPLPDIYLMTCERLGVRPAETFAVEDSRNGIISCSEAGMIPILVPDLIEPDEEMTRRARYIFRDLFQVRDMLAE